MVPVKFNALNQLPVVNVIIAEPLVIDKFGALVTVPLVVPKVNVRVTDASVTNPPVVADCVKLVTSAILRTVVAAVVVVNIMLFEPKLIERITAPVDMNEPVVKLNPFKTIDPQVNVYAPVVVNAYALPTTNVPAVCVNVGTGLSVPPSYVSEPDVNIKLTLGVMVP